MRGGVGVLSVFEGLRKQWCRMLALKQAKQALKSSSNFSLALFGKVREKCNVQTWVPVFITPGSDKKRTWPSVSSST